MPLTAEVLRRGGVPEAAAREYVELLKAAMREFDITTPKRASAFLAQVCHESDRLTAFEERASGAEYEGNKVLGNTQPGDGVRFKGRGPIQLTGRWNYTHYGRLLGLDLVRRPELAATPRQGFRLAAAYFEDRGCNAAADRGDFDGVTRLINAAGLHADRRRALHRIFSELDCVPGRAYIGRGDEGDAVRVLTRRLAFVRRSAGGPQYLDRSRSRYDAEVEEAVRAFQRDRGLEADGRYGPKTAKALARAVVRQKQRRAGARGPRPAAPAAAPTKLPALVREYRRLEGETDAAWRRVVEHGRRRRATLASLRRREPGPARGSVPDAAALDDLTRILLRIEAKLGTLVAVERHEAAAGGEGPAGEARDVAVLRPGAEPATGNGAGQPAAPPRRPRSEDELLVRVDRLDAALERSRAALIARYARADKELLRVAPPPRPKKPAHRRSPQDGGAPKPRPAEVVPRPPATDDAAGGTPPSRRVETLSAEEVRTLQRELNAFTERHLEGLGPILVDGVMGPATRKRIRRAKYFLGYAGAEQRTAALPPEFLERLRHPRSPRHTPPRMLQRAIRRRRAERKAARRSAVARPGVATFDGRPVAAWIKPHLDWARENGWTGTLNSGFRDPVYSEQLCMQICGAPRCPGRCAGRTSNHAGAAQPAGAIDVSDYVRFAELMRRCPHQPRIFNALPRTDPVHFSASGR